MNSRNPQKPIIPSGLAGGHNLPQMLTMSSNPRLAVSKSNKEETEGNMPNIITNIQAEAPNLPNQEKDTKANVKEQLDWSLPINNNEDTDKNIPVENIEKVDTAKVPSKDPVTLLSHTPATPVKLRIRNALKQDREIITTVQEAPVPVISTTRDNAIGTPVCSTEGRTRRQCISDPGPLKKRIERREKNKGILFNSTVVVLMPYSCVFCDGLCTVHNLCQPNLPQGVDG